MPHINISMYPGRDKEIKETPAKAMRDAMAKELNIDENVITVSICDIEKENFQDYINKIPKKERFI